MATRSPLVALNGGAAELPTGDVLPVAVLPIFVADTGSAAGTKGLVPAPAAGDAAAGKLLRADGTWAVPAATSGAPTATRTISTADTIGASDKGKVLNLSGTFTLGATAAATLGAGFSCYLRKRDGSGRVTFDPNAAETVDGLATIALYQEDVLVWTDGASWFTQGREKGWVPLAKVVLTGQALASASITDGFLDLEITEVEVNYSNLICSTSTSVGLRPLKNGAVIASPSYTIEATGTAGTTTATPTSTTGLSANGGASLVSTATTAAQWGVINARDTQSSVPAQQRIDWEGRQVGATRRGTIFDTSTTAQVSGIGLILTAGNITSISYTVKGYRP